MRCLSNRILTPPFMLVKELVDLGQDAIRAVVVERAVDEVILDVDNEERSVGVRVLGCADACVLSTAVSTSEEGKVASTSHLGREYPREHRGWIS